MALKRRNAVAGRAALRRAVDRRRPQARNQLIKRGSRGRRHDRAGDPRCRPSASSRSPMASRSRVPCPSVWNGEPPGSGVGQRAHQPARQHRRAGVRPACAGRRDGQPPRAQSWAVAQIWLALDGLDPDARRQRARLRDFMSATRDSVCQCWRETEDKLPHTLQRPGCSIRLRAMINPPRLTKSRTCSNARARPAGGRCSPSTARRSERLDVGDRVDGARIASPARA